MLLVLLLLVLLVRPGALAIILPPEMAGKSLNRRARTGGRESYLLEPSQIRNCQQYRKST